MMYDVYVDVLCMTYMIQKGNNHILMINDKRSHIMFNSTIESTAKVTMANQPFRACGEERGCNFICTLFFAIMPSLLVLLKC